MFGTVRSWAWTSKSYPRSRDVTWQTPFAIPFMYFLSNRRSSLSMSSVNHSNLTGHSVKDSRNTMHSPTISHHRLVRRGVETASHKSTVHPVNKYGNTRDATSAMEGSAASSSYRMNNSGYLVLGALFALIVVSNTR